MNGKIIFYRSKCIGCNACVEIDRSRWRISRKDGKCNLVGSVEKRGVHVADIRQDEYERTLTAANTCPMRIIQVA